MNEYDKAARIVILEKSKSLYPNNPELQESFMTGAEFVNRPEFKEMVADVMKKF